MDLPFDPATLDYSKRIIGTEKMPPAPLSNLRFTLVGKSGTRYSFNLYTYAPYFEETPRHLFSPCGRLIVLRHRVALDDETTVSVPGQFHVFFNGHAVPAERYAFRVAQRERAAKRTSAYRRTYGRDTEAAAMPGYYT